MDSRSTNTVRYMARAGTAVCLELTPHGAHYKYTQVFVPDASPEAVGVDSSGAIYGPAYYGGKDAPTCPVYGCGIVFKLTPSGHGYKETAFYFGGGRGGHTPNRPLILDQSGNLYGTTGRGGLYPGWCAGATHGCGVAFKLTPSAHGYKETVIYYLVPKGRGRAVTPAAGFLADSTGALYGTTAVGGSYRERCDIASQPPGCGTVFKLTPWGSRYKRKACCMSSAAVMMESLQTQRLSPAATAPSTAQLWKAVVQTTGLFSK